MGRSHICQPLRRFAPPPHEWGGACFHAPLPDPLPCGERGIQIGSAPPAASPPPPHKWGGALFHAPLPAPLPWREGGINCSAPPFQFHQFCTFVLSSFLLCDFFCGCG